MRKLTLLLILIISASVVAGAVPVQTPSEKSSQCKYLLDSKFEDGNLELKVKTCCKVYLKITGRKTLPVLKKVISGDEEVKPRELGMRKTEKALIVLLEKGSYEIIISGSEGVNVFFHSQ